MIGSSRQDDGVLIGPFGGVAPNLLHRIPEVAPGRVSHNPLWETAPDMESEVNLQRENKKMGPFVLTGISK